MWHQHELTLAPKSRGFHLVTEEILRELPMLATVSVGVLHLFIQHSSASLAINENADPTVRADMERYFLRSVPDDSDYFVHTYEGEDDMPAHIKSVLIGCDISVPVKNGRLALGTWQGIYLGEHRHRGGARCIIATIQGE